MIRILDGKYWGSLVAVAATGVIMVGAVALNGPAKPVVVDKGQLTGAILTLFGCYIFIRYGFPAIARWQGIDVAKEQAEFSKRLLAEADAEVKQPARNGTK